MKLYKGKDFIINFATHAVEAIDVLESIEKYFKEDKPYDTAYTFIKQTISWGLSELRGECCVGEEEFYKMAHHFRILGNGIVELNDNNNDYEIASRIIRAYKVMTLANGNLVIIKFEDSKIKKENVIVFYRLQKGSTFLYTSSGSVDTELVDYIVKLFDVFEDLSLP